MQCDRVNRNLRIQIDPSAVRHNFALARRAASQSRIFAVVKSDAYGHGLEQVVPALSHAEGFAVVTVDEALAVRRLAQPEQRVLALQGPLSVDQLYRCHVHHIEMVLHTAPQLELIKTAGVARPRCWVKFDSGMGRLGFSLAQSDSVFEQLRLCEVEICGAISHLACADDTDDPFTDVQIEQFISAVQHQTNVLSMANSAALLSQPDGHFQWVRPGLMLYGASPLLNRNGSDLGLRAAMKVQAPVIAVRTLPAQSKVGYGASFQCTHDTRVAVIGAGYGDGYPRNLVNAAPVSVDGEICPVIGRVSMDSMVIDISSLVGKLPEIGQPVILWGDGVVNVEEIASCAGTIAYELLCSIRGVRR